VFFTEKDEDLLEAEIDWSLRSCCWVESQRL